jgi:tRNA nucleotidyltransferase (CCA-adding enzyme)
MAPRITLTDEEQRLRKLLLDVTEYIDHNAGQSKPQLRFAGGWVRDKLLGTGSNDIDIAVDNMTGLTFAQHMKDFAEKSEKASQYGEDIVSRISKIPARPEQSKHLETATLTVFGLAIDIANLRKETYSEDSRNPQMQFGTPEEDALRRDATVNALFYNIHDDKVEDLTKRGLQDMELRIIRTPLEPYQTFKDDPLRVLRCIRFASRLDYIIDPAAEESMSNSEIQEALRLKISRERVGVEIEKMLKGRFPC